MSKLRVQLSDLEAEESRLQLNLTRLQSRQMEVPYELEQAKKQWLNRKLQLEQQLADCPSQIESTTKRIEANRESQRKVREQIAAEESGS